MKTYRRPRHTGSVAYHLRLAQRRAQQLHLLQEVSHQIAAALEVETVLDRLVHTVYDKLGYRFVAAALVEGNHLVFHNIAGAPDVAIPPFPEALPLDGPGLATWAVRHASPVLLDDVAGDPRYLTRVSTTRSELIVPMFGRAGVLGVIDLQSDQVGAFDEQDLSLIQTLAEHVATAIENARRYQHERLLVADLEHSYNELLQTLTELERKEEQLERTARMRALGELASGVAHDFNNLLAGILGNAQLLLLDECDSERRHMLSVIEQAAQDGAATVRRIQEFARQGEGRVRALVNLAEVVDGALAITRSRWSDEAHRDGHRIHIRHELRESLFVLGNATELRELLINLIINAVDAMPSGGELALRLDEQQVEIEGAALGRRPFLQRMAVIEVVDSGAGIPPELQDRIFDSFFSTKPAGQGSGLGLAICRNIVNRHGGRIELHSAVGRGTTFRVLLPLDEEASYQSSVVRPDAPARACRVLVVDDEPAVREVLTRILQRGGHDVTAAASGEEAIEGFAPGTYDLLFTDLGMPGMGGAALLSHLHARDPDLVAVVVTGWGQLEDTESNLAGAARILAKPFNATQIMDLVGELTSSPAA